MNKYIVRHFGAPDESDYYEAHFANSKEELVEKLNNKREEILKENDLFGEYQKNYNKLYPGMYPWDNYKDNDTFIKLREKYDEYMDKCPYKLRRYSEYKLESKYVFQFPEEFWEDLREFTVRNDGQ